MDGEQDAQGNGFSILNFYRLFDVVSQVTLMSWDKLYDIDIREFMTYVSYAHLKYKEKEQQMRKYAK